jgi:hypothetical protein
MTFTQLAKRRAPRSRERGSGAGGRNQKALARLHSRARYSLALLTAEGGGSFAAPTGHALSSALRPRTGKLWLTPKRK